jgi:hypothetical protein
MPGSEQQDRVALMSVNDEYIIGVVITRDILEVDVMERQTMLE